MKPAILALAFVAVLVACVNWLPSDYIASKIDIGRALFWFRFWH